MSWLCAYTYDIWVNRSTFDDKRRKHSKLINTKDDLKDFIHSSFLRIVQFSGCGDRFCPGTFTFTRSKLASTSKEEGDEEGHDRQHVHHIHTVLQDQNNHTISCNIRIIIQYPTISEWSCNILQYQISHEVNYDIWYVINGEGCHAH